eukprot:CAMPEP_0184481360 /NCGR_PEP_ID=MMETSP0113_2-20130426/2916_1 /TAXON_ID=91329 /ORGANISM="Norrisiella sphaerica, Strain BC52" /LENGTH=98 /DNA_ID=CAMNT_0026860455 /DNA_START=693 /DNA_END=989 /DNA_ORIENTATION=+
MTGAYFSRYHGISAIGGTGNLIFYADFLLQRNFGASFLAAIVRRLDNHANELVEDIGTQLKVIPSRGSTEGVGSSNATPSTERLLHQKMSAGETEAGL